MQNPGISADEQAARIREHFGRKLEPYTLGDGLRQRILTAARVHDQMTADLFTAALSVDLAWLVFELHPHTRAAEGRVERRRGRPREEPLRRFAAALASTFRTELGREPGVGRDTPFGKVFSVCVGPIYGCCDSLPYLKHGVARGRGLPSIYWRPRGAIAAAGLPPALRPKR